MKNADMPIAFVEGNDPEFVRQCRPMKGLTKREYFAGLAMQAIATDSDFGGDPTDAADLACDYADALLARLEATK